MGKLSIHCENCGSDWVVYHRDDWKNWKARTCPVCGKSIDPGTWERSVLKGFGEMEDANIELFKDHTQSHGTLFTVSYIPNVLFPANLDYTREENKMTIREISEKINKIAHSAFDELANANTKERKEAVCESIRSGSYYHRMAQLRNEIDYEDLRYLDDLIHYFSKCANDPGLIDKWDSLA